VSTVLVIGAGGREHALAWKLAQSPSVTRLIIAPGNDGMDPAWERWKFSVQKSEFEVLARRALEEKVDLVVVGPDNPLAEGIVDVLSAQGILTFGPRENAARLESSKIFAKEVMSAAGVPTAKYFSASSLAEARKVLSSVPWPPQMGSGWVIKADGLALGKGVIVCASEAEGLRACETLLPISGKILIEECLKGEELSWFAFCDGERCALLEPARDYKRVFDGDQGPNTGGMGAFSPVPGVTDSLAETVRERVFLPVLREMKKRGVPFRGLLYAGLMADLAREKIWVIEFNARFGDPETQPLMARVQGDIYPWFEACAKGDLGALPVQVPFSGRAAVVVIAAARGYPEAPEKGKALSGVKSGEPMVFFAGVTRGVDGALQTSGGRVLGVLGIGEDLEVARRNAYAHLARIDFPGMHFRRDVAKR
jgi:phosphoribosylamine--glycine ligase